MMDGVGGIDIIDDLLIHLLITDEVRYYSPQYDDPTVLPPHPFLDRGREVQIGWYRKQACSDGEHSWDMAYVGDEKPEGNKRFGAFLGAYLG